MSELLLVGGTGLLGGRIAGRLAERGVPFRALVRPGTDASALVALAEIYFGGPQRLTRREVVDAFERATGSRFRRVTVPRPVMALGSRVLRRRNPALASVMGMSLSSDETELPIDDRPLRELGIEPRSTTDAIERMVGARSPE
jgi:uncharacterized protein YbjT (DUF2867 family)